MAPGTSSAAGDEYAPALASEASYCSRSRTTLSSCQRTGVSLPAYSAEPSA